MWQSACTQNINATPFVNEEDYAKTMMSRLTAFCRKQHGLQYTKLRSHLSFISMQSGLAFGKRNEVTRLILLGILNPEDEGTMIIRNLDNYYQSKQRKNTRNILIFDTADRTSNPAT